MVNTSNQGRQNAYKGLRVILCGFSPAPAFLSGMEALKHEMESIGNVNW